MMAFTLDDFCSYLFVPLLLLGLWCLFEGKTSVCLKMLLLEMLTVFNTMQCNAGVFFFIISSLEIAILGGRCKSWYLPYRFTEVPWNMAEVKTKDYLKFSPCVYR